MMKNISLFLCLSVAVNFFPQCSGCIEYGLFSQKICANTTGNQCEWKNRKLVHRREEEENHEGVIDVEMPLLNTCGNTALKFTLYVDESITSAEECSYAESKSNWKVHSKFKIEPEVCAKQTNIPYIALKYIFTGCYKISLYDCNSCIFIGESHSTFITTEYKKKRLTDDDSITILRNMLRKNKELEIIITLHSNDTIKPPNILVLLGEDAKGKMDEDSEGTLEIKCLDKRCTNFDESFSVVKTFRNVTFNCTSQRDYYNHIIYTCKYEGLNPGKHSFTYFLLDEYIRCQEGTIWATPSQACERRYPFDIPEVLPHHDNESLDVEYWIVLCIIILIAAVLIFSTILLYLTYRYKNIRKKKKEQNSETSSEYTSIVNISEESIPKGVPQGILLIYTRESEAFLNVIKQFKLLFQQAGDIRIYDINEYDENIHIDPQKWISDKIEDPNIMNILFLNIASKPFYEKYPSITYVDEQCSDKYFPFAIKQLGVNFNTNYKKLFVLQLNNVSSMCTPFSGLSTGKRYVMPDDVNVLVDKFLLNEQTLSSDTVVNFNESCKIYQNLVTNNPLQYLSKILIVR